VSVSAGPVPGTERVCVESVATLAPRMADIAGKQMRADARDALAPSGGLRTGARHGYDFGAEA